MNKFLRLKLSSEEMEMIQVSVAERLRSWEITRDFLEGGSVSGLIEDCHKPEEARWMTERYRNLMDRLDVQKPEI